MKQTLVILGFGILTLGFVAGGCGWAAVDFGRRFLNNSLKIENWDLKIFKWCFNGLPFVDKLDQLLADKTYIILLQNNRELRPTGGFMGSYARFKVGGSGLKDFEVQDIYVPDGQLAGHVDPPIPIQQAFGQGWWKLRDANWDPDFTVAAPQIAWFFDQAGEKVDGIVAINLTQVVAVLEILGEVKTTDYPQVVSARTFYDLAQRYAEVGSFPGSTQKRDFLGAVGSALFKRIQQSQPIERIKLIKLVWQELKRGEILVWFRDPQLQEVVGQRSWDGSLGDYTADYLYIVETNLGANKANCCVDREVTQTVDSPSSSTSLRIDYRNDHPFTDPRPPEFWGGNYINYLRIVIPRAAQVQGVRVAERGLAEKPLDYQYGLQEERYEVEDRGRFKIVGFWAVVPAQSSTQVEVIYDLRFADSDKRQVLVKHQPGMEPFTYRLVYQSGLVIGGDIDRDREVVVKRR